MNIKYNNNYNYNQYSSNNNYDSQINKNSMKSLISVNDKEILLDNRGNFNLNINSEDSPQKFSNYNNTNKYYFGSNSNVIGKDYQNIGDVLSPVTATVGEKDKDKRKDNFMNNHMLPNFHLNKNH